LTGWNAIKSRAQQLKLEMTDTQYKECTAKIKAMADIRPIAVDDADSIIRAYHRNLKSGENKPLLDLTAEEHAAFVAKEKELLEAQAAGLVV
jgi:homocitrate synthase